MSAVTLSCPNCGSKLQITDELDRFVCQFCGTEQIVRRSGGVVSLQPIVEGMARIQSGTDKTAAELAIRRLTDEIAAAKVAASQPDTRKPDQIIAPSWTETVLLLASLGALVLGVYSLDPEGALRICGGVILAIVLFVAYIWVRTVRISKTKKVQAKARAENVNKLEIELATNRRIVSG